MIPTKGRNTEGVDTPSAPQVTPRQIGAGHPEYQFVQAISEVNRSLGSIQTKLDSHKSDLSSIKQDIRDIKTDHGNIRKELHDSKVQTLVWMGAGFAMLLGLFFVQLDRLSDKEDKLVTAVSDMRITIQQAVDLIATKKDK